MNGVAMTDDRLHILLDQLNGAWEMLDARLHDRKPWQSERGSTAMTLTDDEYFWEPAPNCWSLRPRGQAHSPKPLGRGDSVLDSGPYETPSHITTIAWRLCHMAQGEMMRYDWTFGAHSLMPDDIEWPPTATNAVAFLTASHMRWRNAVAEMTSAELDQIGRSQMPHGLDPQVRFVDLLAWTNLEFAHHAAEIALLRDLYAARPL